MKTNKEIIEERYKRLKSPTHKAFRGIKNKWVFWAAELDQNYSTLTFDLSSLDIVALGMRIDKEARQAGAQEERRTIARLFLRRKPGKYSLCRVCKTDKYLKAPESLCDIYPICFNCFIGRIRKGDADE